jgi:hypothetical protein
MNFGGVNTINVYEYVFMTKEHKIDFFCRILRAIRIDILYSVSLRLEGISPRGERNILH